MTTTTTTTTIPIRIEALAFLAIALCMCGLSLFGTYATFLAGDPTVEVLAFFVGSCCGEWNRGLNCSTLGPAFSPSVACSCGGGHAIRRRASGSRSGRTFRCIFHAGSGGLSSSRLGIVRDLRAVVRNGLEPIRLCPARHRRLRNVAWHRFQLLPSSFRRDGSLPRGRIMRHSRLHFSGNAATSYRCRCASNPTRA